MNVPPRDTEEMRRLVSEGWSLQEIAEHFGISRQAVQQRLRGKRCRTKGAAPEQPLGPYERPWIREERLSRGWSQTDLANEARKHIPPDVLAKHKKESDKLSQGEISRIEGNAKTPRRRVDPIYAEAIEKALQKDRGWVMFGGPQPQMRRILGEMLADETIRMLPEEERPALELNGFRGNIGPDVVVFRVMAEHHPRYDPGETLLCYEEKRSIEECIGRRCVVQLEDGRRYVGRVEPGASERLVTIRPWLESNPLQIDKTPVWISPIFSTIGPESKRT